MSCISEYYWQSSKDGNSAGTMFPKDNSEYTDGCAVYEIKTIRNGSLLYSKSLYMDDFWGPPDFSKYNSDENYRPPKELIEKYIKAGIEIYYDSNYKLYWNRLIEEHLNRN